MIILTIATWLLLIMLRAMPLVPAKLSHYELKRKHKQGDTKFWEIESRIGGLRVLRDILYSIVLIALALSLAEHEFYGFLIASVLVCVAEAVSRIPQLRHAAYDLLEAHHAQIFRVTDKITGSLNWLHDWHHTEKPVYSKEELLHVIEKSRGILNRDEEKAVVSLLQYSDKLVKEIMTPRSVIETVSIDDTVGPMLMDQLHKTSHNRFPVIDQDADHVVGMLYLRDIVNLRATHNSVREAMRADVFYLREDDTLNHALNAFLRSRHHLFIVINEFGETVGLLSLEDVMEQMIGRSVVDEFDAYDDLRAVAKANYINHKERESKS